MNVYIFIDNPDLGEQHDDAIASLQACIGEDNPHATLVNETANDEQDIERLGIVFTLKRSKYLHTPLADLYKIALKYKCDFVVGIVEGDAYEDICYFGIEEGKPDAYEIGCYLGLK